jgi:hypothetical protein
MFATNQSSTPQIKTRGSLGSINIKDLTEQAKEFPDFFQIEGEHMVEFFYQTFADASLVYDSWLMLRMNSVRVTYVQRFATLLSRYFNEMTAMRQLLTSTASKAAEVAKDAATIFQKRKIIGSFPYLSFV